MANIGSTQQELDKMRTELEQTKESLEKTISQTTGFAREFAQTQLAQTKLNLEKINYEIDYIDVCLNGKCGKKTCCNCLKGAPKWYVRFNKSPNDTGFYSMKSRLPTFQTSVACTALKELPADVEIGITYMLLVRDNFVPYEG
jgi:hypothetical protein